MYFKYIRYVVISFLLIWVSACSSKGGGESSTNTLLDENTPPVAYDQNITLSKIELMENGELDIVLEAVDSDGDSLIYTILQYPKHGSLSGDMPDVIYIPESNYVGEDSFVFEVSDGISTSKGVVNIIILSQGTSSDTPPKTQTQDHNETKPQDTNSSDNNTTTTIKPPEVKDPEVPQDDNVSEPDKDENSTSIIPPKAQDDNTTTPNKPSDHNVTIPHTPQDTNSSDNNTTTTIQPPEVKDPEVPQDDNVSEPNKDENSTSVNNSNHIPIAYSQFIIKTDKVKDIVLKGYDEDNDSLLYSIVSPPYIGRLNGNAPQVEYSSNNDNKIDCFGFKVNDGLEDSKNAIVTILNTKEDINITSFSENMISIEDFSLYIKEKNKIYRYPIIGTDLKISKDIILKYQVYKHLNSSGYGYIYIRLQNDTLNNIEDLKVFFFMDLSIEESSNTFFNEFGKYVGIKADYWQIDEPDYLSGNIVKNLNKGTLDNTNHIASQNIDDVAMALGFDIDSIDMGEMRIFKITLSPNNIGGLVQIDDTTHHKVYFDVDMILPVNEVCR